MHPTSIADLAILFHPSCECWLARLRSQQRPAPCLSANVTCRQRFAWLPALVMYLHTCADGVSYGTGFDRVPAWRKVQLGAGRLEETPGNATQISLMRLARVGAPSWCGKGAKEAQSHGPRDSPGRFASWGTTRPGDLDASIPADQQTPGSRCGERDTEIVKARVRSKFVFIPLCASSLDVKYGEGQIVFTSSLHTKTTRIPISRPDEATAESMIPSPAPERRRRRRCRLSLRLAPFPTPWGSRHHFRSSDPRALHCASCGLNVKLKGIERRASVSEDGARRGFE
jgi:hypothetical protein